MFILPPFDVESPSFDEFRRILISHSIPITDDDPDSGLLAFIFGDFYCAFTRNGHCYARVPLAYHDDIEMADRSVFDADYRRFYDLVLEAHGKPVQDGQFVYDHRPSDWYYHYSVWQLDHCRLALTQNEYDIQFGLDISLTYLYFDGNSEGLLFGN
ncbi:MAG: hypothetical protein JWN70_916 [Planctomycetaceae bacterium]|nr:hypothetical protein [Planctomycetaceae bacterium]